ncbi:endothelial cell-specific chemotaxis regulator isoform X5 [Pongo abelii]|uniref:endothelial cell-specific chemotaxis regulator isoform X5 n=1 Tax=Pongo abelii TaxID=9601 RepID=UPI0023E7A6D0|nr:endothelial cell-specific chemotaxis regulator isoform X4 [Pongo abelii]
MDPSEGKRMGMGPGCHGSSWRASPHPHPAPALPLSSPLWTEPPLSCCLPATYPADVGTAGAMQLCWVILGFLLFQGHNSQPATTQTSSSQGGLGSLSLTTEPVSSNPGYIPSSEANSPSHLSNTGTPGAGVPSSGRDGGTSRDTFQTVPPNSTTMSLSMREDVTILPSPTSETVLTVAAFGESGRRRCYQLHCHPGGCGDRPSRCGQPEVQVSEEQGV